MSREKKKHKEASETKASSKEQNAEKPLEIDMGEPDTEETKNEKAPASADEKIAELEADLAMAQDRALRCAAELENYKKRMAREATEERRYASMPLMRDILPVLDNMGRAIDTVEQGHDPSHLLEGVKMVRQQLEGVLAKYDCVEIAALDHPFDPNFHEAILHQPSADVDPNTVIQVTQTGYRLHDRVVRPSNVIVSKAVEEVKEDAEEVDPE